MPSTPQPDSPAGQAGERPRRLTQSEIIQQLLAKGSSEHHSISLSRNAKGETQIEVVIRSGGDDAPTATDAEQLATGIYDRLRAKYPMASGYVGAQPAEGTQP